jgi:hypothetical protein
MASLTLRPGARVRLKGQAAHVPDFYVVCCEYDQCWVRQHNWSPDAAINVRFSQLFIPDLSSVAPAAVVGGSALALPPLVPVAPAMASAEVQAFPQRLPDNVIDMAAYRRRKAR